MSEHTQYIKALISGMGFSFTEAAWLDILEIWEEVHIPKRTILSQPGTAEKYLYFVVKGAQRVYYFDDQDREATLVFSYPYSFAGVLDAFLLQTPSKYYFETITSSVLLKTNFDAFTTVAHKHPEFAAFIAKAEHYVLSGLLDRIVELQCFSSEDKFRRLLHRSPHILQHVPQKYLANYLGMDPTNFSKLMHSVKL